MVFIAIAYIWMGIDYLFALWPSIGLDYSTHTAVLLVLLAYLGWLYSLRRGYFGAALLLISYAGLMIYLGFHSLLDILTTGAVVALTLGLVDRMLVRFTPNDRT